MRNMAKRKRTYNTNLIKKTISYSIFQIAELYRLDKGTVRHWLKEGLKKIDGKRPFLVNGADLKEFLKNRQNKRKRKCNPDELYCFRCRLPQKAKDNAVILNILSHKRGRLSGLCSECGLKINRGVSLENVTEINKIFKVIKIHNKDLTGFSLPIVNTDLKEESLT